jgi:hypothetical protein
MAATPIQAIDTSSWTFDEPKNSKISPGTYNAYVNGGPYHFAIHGELNTNAINPNATPAERAAALKDLPAILSEGHIVGSQWSTPEDDTQTVLIKVPPFAVGPLQDVNDTCFNALYKNMKAWNLKQASKETLSDQWDPLLKQKDGTEGYAMSCKFYTKKIKIDVQNPEQYNDFDPDGTQFHMKQGIRFAAVVRVGGIRIRIKPREYSCTKPVITKIMLFTGGGEAPDMDLGGVSITHTAKLLSSNPAAAEDPDDDESDDEYAGAAAASQFDPMTATMVGDE